jgi:hypothetical protein
MSTALKPCVAITQMQLLGDVSPDDLVKMRHTKQPAAEEHASSSHEQPFAWTVYNEQ